MNIDIGSISNRKYKLFKNIQEHSGHGDEKLLTGSKLYNIRGFVFKMVIGKVMFNDRKIPSGDLQWKIFDLNLDALSAFAILLLLVIALISQFENTFNWSLALKNLLIILSL